MNDDSAFFSDDEFWIQEHGRSQTFDLGHRSAIYRQVKALCLQMRDQVNRSRSTLNNSRTDEQRAYNDIMHLQDQVNLRLLEIISSNWWFEPKPPKE